ncbi:hypothetical protein PF002_g5430 [Phytophthora fragariae]|uniref:Uncharacterized protein n=1 Tax=Phytophthora fragariae TaxID=53985 RepID=A0A6A4A165_9STRA|nr:hypothetical protein PF002_g5430 [Phytophthora fragariae]
MAAVMDNLCGWCGVTRWQYKCSSCDPRAEKRLCSSCSILWHSRGFARSHQLTSSYGETRSYIAWGSPREHNASNGGDNSSVEAETTLSTDVAANGVEDRSAPARGPKDAAAPEEEKAAENGHSIAGAEDDPIVPIETKQADGEKENESAEEEFEFETVGESVDSGEDGDTASVEQDGALEAEETHAARRSVAGNSAAASKPMTEVDELKKGKQVSTRSAEASEDTPTGPHAAESSRDDTNNELLTATREGAEHTQGDDADALQSQNTLSDSIPGNANFNADFINQLLLAKVENGDGREVAQREFDGVMELGYAIVDASFCAPSKAQRCLLNCKSILVHLQHHLDLQVCTQPMCTAVEHHFAHLSQCKAQDKSDSCEYCLRVEERQLIRSVDFMEAEQPEAEAKVQKIINDITASFTNHPDEREKEMIQLEDELEQVEENKRELADKLNDARHDLRRVHKNLEHRGMSTTGSRRLQVHFIKIRRNEGSNGSSKKRRLLGSLL